MSMPHVVAAGVKKRIIVLTASNVTAWAANKRWFF
jgi:hypothetical protein